MIGSIRFHITCSAFLVGVLSVPSSLAAQSTTQPRPPASRPAPAPRTPVGVDVFGGAGFTFPAAQDSFDALDLSSTPVDFGGGVRVNGLWGKLFVQGTFSRWSDTGERAFIASDGTSFPLGIPLDVNATFIDGSIGVREVMRAANGRISFIPYIGGGVGIVRYEERSPFAEAGDDLDTSKPSYHVLVGVEVPLNRWLAFGVDGRYRYIPGILGDDGASALLEEDALGGFQTSIGLRVGFGGPPYIVPPAKRPPTTTTPAPSAGTPARSARPEGMISASAPVYLLPDATRAPLRTLTAGTMVRILSIKGDWTEVEFNDPQYGPRVGWVQSKFVRRQ